MLDKIRAESEKKMQKSKEALSQELAKLRTGRAHPSLLDGIVVEYYGQPTALNQVASVVVSDSRTLTVTPFEKTMVIPVDKAIRASELGLNPSTAGQVIRIPLPPLTEESRKNLTKQMKATVENARVAIRGARRDANNKTKSLLKDKTISEDEARQIEDAIQKSTNQFIDMVDKMANEKEADLMQV